MNYIETATIRRGALSFVLQIARITGAVPLSLKVLKNGYRVSVCSYQLAYSLLLITTLNIIGSFGIFVDWKKSAKIENRTFTRIFLLVFERVACILVCSIGYIGSKRTKNMIYHINIIEKIRNRINYSYKSVAEDKKIKWISSVVILTHVIASTFDITVSLLCSTKWDIGMILCNIHCLEYTTMMMLHVPTLVLSFEVYKVLVDLKEKLRFLITIANNGTDNLTIAEARMINIEVRNLTQCYVTVCDVVRKINNAEGFYIFVMYETCHLLLMFIGYRFILVLAVTNDMLDIHGVADLIPLSFWGTAFVLRTFFFVEPSYRISKEVAEMKVLLIQLMLHMTPPGNQMSIEIDIMIKEILLNVPEHCPLGIYKLNRSLITKTYNVMITCLVFIFQLESNQ